MTHPLTLEDFSMPTPSAEATGATQVPDPAQPLSEDAQLELYEQGYQSGWDDCAAAEVENNRKIAADLAANLQDLAMTYAEARRDILKALGPLFDDIAGQLLPALAAEAVAPAVIAELRDIAEASSDGRATLIASPVALPALERLIDTETGLQISLEAEPAFADGQVAIRFDAEKREIDLTSATEQMAHAIREFVADASAADPRALQGVA